MEITLNAQETALVLEEGDVAIAYSNGNTQDELQFQLEQLLFNLLSYKPEDIYGTFIVNGENVVEEIGKRPRRPSAPQQ